MGCRKYSGKKVGYISNSKRKHSANIAQKQHFFQGAQTNLCDSTEVKTTAFKGKLFSEALKKEVVLCGI